MLVCLAAAAFVLGSPRASSQEVALKTNALMLAGLTPNFGCEIVTGEHTSVDFSLFGHYKPYGLNSKMIGLQPEFKYWFNGRPMIREYVGAGLLYTSYDITGRRQVFDGDAVGLGLTGGYVFALGKRWNLELSGSFGLVFFRQKQYNIGDNFDDYYVNRPPKPNSMGYKIMPVDLGVSFTYIIK